MPPVMNRKRLRSTRRKPWLHVLSKRPRLPASSPPSTGGRTYKKAYFLYLLRIARLYKHFGRAPDPGFKNREPSETLDTSFRRGFGHWFFRGRGSILHLRHEKGMTFATRRVDVGVRHAGYRFIRALPTLPPLKPGDRPATDARSAPSAGNPPPDTLSLASDDNPASDEPCIHYDTAIISVLYSVIDQLVPLLPPRFGWTHRYAANYFAKLNGSIVSIGPALTLVQLLLARIKKPMFLFIEGAEALDGYYALPVVKHRWVGDESGAMLLVEEQKTRKLYWANPDVGRLVGILRANRRKMKVLFTTTDRCFSLSAFLGKGEFAFVSDNVAEQGESASVSDDKVVEFPDMDWVLSQRTKEVTWNDYLNVLRVDKWIKDVTMEWETWDGDDDGDGLVDADGGRPSQTLSAVPGSGTMHLDELED